MNGHRIQIALLTIIAIVFLTIFAHHEKILQTLLSIDGDTVRRRLLVIVER